MSTTAKIATVSLVAAFFFARVAFGQDIDAQSVGICARQETECTEIVSTSISSDSRLNTSTTDPSFAGLEEQETGRSEKHRSKVEKVIEKEGGPYSEIKLNKYRSRVFNGIILSIVGGAALATSIGLLLSSVYSNLSYVDHSDESTDTNNQEEGFRRYRVGGAIAMAAGFVSISFSVPLIISGASGKKRQIFLRDHGTPSSVAQLNVFVLGGKSYSTVGACILF